MASHIPIALSLLSTMANHYTGLQKPASTAQSAPQSSTPLNNVSNVPARLTTSASSTGANVGTSPPSIHPVALCIHCHLRPKHFDGNKTHPYCSKTCANKAKASSVSSTPPTSIVSVSPGNCDFCHNRPKYFDGTRIHPFCSKACARIAVCQAPGCNNPPHINTNGTSSDYCSNAHKLSGSSLPVVKHFLTSSLRRIGETLCLMCLQAPKLANSHFCSQKCADDAEKKGPMILEVPFGHVTFKSVSDQFKASWRHVGTMCPTVRHVYKIISPQPCLVSYNAYRATVESRGQFVAAGRSAGNENRRWHGTRRECNLGDKGHTQFCSSPSCSLCCIVRTSYNLSLWGKKTGWGRFGKGIYTSSTSSKSNDYSHNDCKSHLKSILLNKVVVGKGCKMLQDNTSLTAPPAGYDSVLAEKGGSLNYDELVVYTNDAIRPSFLVMYDEP
ncbi:hypothetical protein BDQ17DRAFT_1391048 [Cyathus striatus]|nr:hypothetical protein BDQ17DRAFT_1391048 [Cyathus striatus]